MVGIETISRWQKILVAGIVVCLLALLLHPVSAAGSVLAACVLFPVLLFGLIPVPRSLWPCRDLDQRRTVLVLSRASLFQRPPPKH